MKVRYKKALCGYEGKSDAAVYYFHPGLKQNLMREYVRPRDSSSTERHKKIMANLKQLCVSAGFKQNLKDYLIRYNQLKCNEEKPLLSWSNLFMKLMFAMQKALPEVDLAVLTREQIFAENLPCRSVKAAIDADLLPKVEYYEKYDAEI